MRGHVVTAPRDCGAAAAACDLASSVCQTFRVLALDALSTRWRRAAVRRHSHPPTQGWRPHPLLSTPLTLEYTFPVVMLWSRVRVTSRKRS